MTSSISDTGTGLSDPRSHAESTVPHTAYSTTIESLAKPTERNSPIETEFRMYTVTVDPQLTLDNRAQARWQFSRIGLTVTSADPTDQGLIPTVRWHVAGYVYTRSRVLDLQLAHRYRLSKGSAERRWDGAGPATSADDAEQSKQTSRKELVRRFKGLLIAQARLLERELDETCGNADGTGVQSTFHVLFEVNDGD